MTQSPPVPRSRRNLSDLDALIDASIGKGETYGAVQPSAEKTVLDPEAENPAAEEALTSNPSSTVSPNIPDLPFVNGAVGETKPERFRISIDAAVIMATKMRAVQQKVSPSAIVERALRHYLNFPAS